MTIAAALAVGIMRLRSREAPPEIRSSASVDAQALLGEVLDADRAWMLAHGSEELDGDLLDVFGLLLDERMRGVPLAYLTHQAGFYGRMFYVDERVLVPRPETEHLLEAALNDLRRRSSDGSGLHALDVGTGSGALALSLAAELPQLRVTATDVCAEALAVAERNARALGLRSRVEFLACDLASQANGRRFDCVVANLPYIPTADIPLPPNPVGFEPLVALDGGEDGLHAYRRLVEQLPQLVAPTGSAFLEAAPPATSALAGLLTRAFANADVRIHEDYAGLSRFVSVTRA